MDRLGEDWQVLQQRKERSLILWMKMQEKNHGSRQAGTNAND